MNRKEWKEFSTLERNKTYWYSKVRKFLKSKEFESLENCDKDAKVIHHLRDTEEQRKYNDEHYEMFGFEIDENGNEHFEYGKYVVFWTKEHHDKYHHCSEETRKLISEKVKSWAATDEGKRILSENSKKNWADESYRNKQLEKMFSDETKAKRAANIVITGNKISASKKGYHHTEEAKQKMSKSHLGKPGMRGSANPNFSKPAYNRGIPMSDEAKQKSRESHLGKSSAHLKACQILYKAYKRGNGVLSWNEFQKCAFSGYISFEMRPYSVFI